MNHAATLTTGLAIGLLMQPVVTRPAADRIVVEGADYAGTQPEPDAIIDGIPLVFGYAWEDGGPIVYAVDPEGDYTVHAFVVDLSTGDREMFSVDFGVTREQHIDRIIRARIEWEAQYAAMLAGTHPDLDGPVTYFEIGQAVLRVRLASQAGEDQGVE